jgi:catechol 2,3-dioxygenase-like lactoylglutathione lyase family enzyme
MPALTLVVVRCRDLEQSRRFYQAISLILTAEQHGTGPLHYSNQTGGSASALLRARFL